MFKLKTKFLAYAAVLLLVVVLASYKFNHSKVALDATVDKNAVLMKVLMQGLSSAHFHPKKIDDNFSKEVYKTYLERLAFNKKFLTQADIAQLKKFETDIDDEVKKGSYEFFEFATNLFQTRVKETEGLYKEILAKPFDFTVAETVETDVDKLEYPADKAALKEAWRKYLKYQTMLQLSDLIDIQEKAKENKDSKVVQKSMAELEAEARKKVVKTYEDFYRRLGQTDKEEWMAIYVNSITNLYDPHTEYFPPKDKEQFDISMTGRLEGIGAQLQEKDGQIKIMEIVPGTPSYRQGELKAGDIILKVAQGRQEPVNVEGMRIDKAIQLIRGKKGTEVRLTVKKPDATIKVIPLIRDVIIIEDTYAQSALIQDKRKVGYIKLPTFYADFARKGGRNSGEDVKNEIAKLKQEGATGIILDLRNNGGGSLPDAVEMTGLFIPEGPVVQVESSGAAPNVLRDRDATTQFDGPVVVMVNSFSASASEILAAALQDYKRAIIVGSSSTYGKGTVQQVFDFDQVLPSEYNALKPFGSLKLTTQKFYRINGGATQLKGVTPDIILPDLYTYIEQGEKEQEHALPWDEIKPADYKTWSKPTLNVERIKANSKQRIANNELFNAITNQAKSFKARADMSNYSLKLADYRAMQKKAKEESSKYETLQKSAPAINVTALKADLATAKSDTVKINRMNRFAKSLNKDIYLEEALNVVKDQFSE
ncbi:carboxy terminal-processing peptidase [Adhaeribacter swui]|uniref:Carboxy terminal-processing peptidase n=1 Tax=Adhaeribacter swui TaxID=2086471 RepID=A0A7G7GA85_9BACT|nr:carboxy terminal-processing peptidase [Adhaeribacter swui]QNF34069.1 carboxy terminal-processing peptidase [Adhaeribacter swui]